MLYRIIVKRFDCILFNNIVRIGRRLGGAKGVLQLRKSAAEEVRQTGFDFFGVFRLSDIGVRFRRGLFDRAHHVLHFGSGRIVRRTACAFRVLGATPLNQIFTMTNVVISNYLLCDSGTVKCYRYGPGELSSFPTGNVLLFDS